MNRSKIRMIPVLYLALGIVGCILYRRIFTLAVDEAGIVIRGTLQEILLWVVTAAALIGAIAVSGKCRMGAAGRFSTAVGNVAFIAGIVTLLQTATKGPELLGLAYRIVALASIVSLAAEAVMRLMGKKPFFLLYPAACLLTILHLMECYQLWSEKPLLLDYFFGVGAVLTLMLFAYYRMASGAGLGAKKGYCFCAIVGIFFCCVAAMQANYPIFFASGAVWMLAELTGLTAAGEE